MDYYKILGIGKTAIPAEVKAAYRKLARKLHPDLNPNDADAKKKFQEINEANEVLSDPEKRKKYDQYGKDWEHAEQFENAKRQKQQQRSSAPGGGATESDFSDFFESMFGGAANTGRGQRVKFRGEDYTTTLELQLLDAAKSFKQTINVNGKSIRINVPAGVENGQTIKIPGHGGPGVNGGPNGDLYLTFSIANHPKFKRLGNDLYASEDIELYTALLGGEHVIDTLDGKVKLKVKPETQNETVVKLKGKGFPVYKKEGQFGDLYVTFSLKIPTNLTDKQKALFEELSKL